MPMHGESREIVRSQIGIQEFLVIDSAPLTDKSKEGQFAKDAGALAVAGNYDMVVDVAGLTNVDVILNTSAVTGTVAPSVFATYADGSTSKVAGTGGANFIATTRQTISVANLKGERKLIVRIPIDATESVTLSQAEVNGK